LNANINWSKESATLAITASGYRISDSSSLPEGYDEQKILLSSTRPVCLKGADAGHFTYYDFKRKAFTPREIMNKERSIRDQMHLWSEYKIFEMLRAAGFVSSNMQLFWRNHLFIGVLAWKPAPFR
jgi:hypothetical protein